MASHDRYLKNVEKQLVQNRVMLMLTVLFILLIHMQCELVAQIEAANESYDNYKSLAVTVPSIIIILFAKAIRSAFWNVSYVG